MTPVLPGATDVSVTFRVLDATTFLPYSSLTSATSGLALWYRVGTSGAVVDLTESDLSALTDAHSDGKLRHVRDGLYRLDLPDAAVPATEGAITVYGGTATGYVILGGALVGKPVEVVSGSLVAASVTGNVGGNVTGSVGSVATGGITAASIAADAIGASELAADAITEIQNGLATSTALSTAQTDLTTLTGRLTSARAGYLDNLSAGAVALQSTLSTLSTTVSGLAAAVWAYATRTLTQGAASVTAAVTGSSVTVYRGTRWNIPLTGQPVNTGYTAILFSVKRRESDADSAAIFQVRTSTGLTAFAGAPTVTAGQAAITVNSSTAITITCEAATTVYATPGTYSYGIKYLDASGDPSQASDGGVFTITGDMPRAIN